MDIRTGYLFGEAAKWWYLFLVAGVFALTTPFFFVLDVHPMIPYALGGGMLLLAITLRSNWYNLQIDTSKGMIREGMVIFGIRTGEWQVLPPIDRVIQTSDNVSFWNTPNGITPTFRSELTMYTIGLFAGENLHYFVQTTNEKQANRWTERIERALM